MAPIEFVKGDMNGNFVLLLVHFGLLPSMDATKEQIAEAEKEVAKLIPSFHFSRNRMKPTKIKVGEGSSKSGLFILFLSKLAGKKIFVRSQQDRELTEEFFTPEIISDAKNPKLSNHPVVRGILSDGSLAIKVENPKKEKKDSSPKSPKKSEKKKAGKKKNKNKKKNKKKKK